MSIDPISSDLTHPFAQSVRAAREASAAPVRSVPGSPPPEVFSAMLTAARAAERLTDSGRALHFSTDGPGGLSVHLTDLDGTVLGTVAPSTVLSIASGEDLG